MQIRNLVNNYTGVNCTEFRGIATPMVRNTALEAVAKGHGYNHDWAAVC